MDLDPMQSYYETVTIVTRVKLLDEDEMTHTF